MVNRDGVTFSSEVRGGRRAAESDVPRQRSSVVARLAQGTSDQESVPERVHVGAAAFPEDGVAVAAPLARREVQRLVHVPEEVDQEAERDPAVSVGFTSSRTGQQLGTGGIGGVDKGRVASDLLACRGH